MWQVRGFPARIRARILSRRALFGDSLVRDLLAPVDAAIRKRLPLGTVLDLLETAREPLASRLAPGAGSRTAGRALAVKTLNLCLARYHLRERGEILLAHPFGLAVDPCNACHVGCPGCVHSRHSRQSGLFDWPPGLLSRPRFERLLKRCGPRATHVTFCNYGEPLLNPETPALIRMAKRYLLRTTLSTSLSVPRFDPEAYVLSGLDFMTVSVDGVTAPVYRRYRRNGNLDLVLSNLRSLVAARRRLNRRTPFISWHFLAFRHNIEEAAAARGMAKSLGLDRFCLVRPFDVTWDDPGIRPARAGRCAEEFNGPADGALRENWNPSPEDLDEGAIDADFEAGWHLPAGLTAASGTEQSGRWTCRWLYKNMVMDAGGRILPCCAAPRPDARLVFAHLEDEGDPFNSDHYRLARLYFSERAAYNAWRSIRESEPAPHCARCKWDQSQVNTGAPELEQYFRTAGGASFDGASLRTLARW